MIFDLLKILLQRLPLLWPENAPQQLFNDSPLLNTWGQETGAFDEIEYQRMRIKSERIFVKFLHDWFDGFRTLKFVHYMRDKHFPSQPLGWICKQDIDLGVSAIDGNSNAISDLEKILGKLSLETLPPAP